MFGDNIIFGTGIKNFRVICKNYELKSMDHCNTHPSQYIIEILSELGIVGFFLIYSFITFIIYKFIINKPYKNLLSLGCVIYVTTYFIPILPSGSFFTSFNATILWLNLGFIYCYYKKKIIS